VDVHEKSCSTCKAVKPITDFHKRGGSRCGYQSECKQCARIRMNAKRANCTPRITGEKQCGACSQVKPVSDFNFDKATNEGLRSTCKDCLKPIKHAWKKANPDKVRWSNKESRRHHLEACKKKERERARCWYAANKDKVREAANQRSRAWHRANPGRARANRIRWYTENKDRALDLGRKWRKENAERYKATNLRNDRSWRAANPERSREAVRIKHNRRRNVPGRHTIDEWKSLVEEFDGRCVRCGDRLGLQKLTRDHVVPITNGGTDNIDNIQPLCKQCNSSKGRRHSTDYRLTPFTRSGRIVNFDSGAKQSANP
jgi:5-methylcytosine-specific restriction endonuclease McrA